MRFLIGGAGLSGAVLARRLADSGHTCTLVEPHRHVAGHCHTERDDETGVMVHRYGPHIFHTDSEIVWEFVNRFADMRPFEFRVRAISRGQAFPLPVNLQTINLFFGREMTPDEAEAYISGLARPSANGSPRNLEEQALATVGSDLYEAFFRGYSEKQWGRSAEELPASVLKRLPVRFTEDASYFDHRFQAIPAAGYTDLVERMLRHPRIEVRLGERLRREQEREPVDRVFFTGPLDDWFGGRQGRLAYRTLDFEEVRAEGDFQGCAVVNYCDLDVPWTRITEHKHLAPWEHHEGTVCFREFSREAGPHDPPYYPIRLVREQAALATYVEMAREERGVSFLGRLGTYRYIDMDQAVAEALAAADETLARLRAGARLPAFFMSPV
jgi:UDP-galactopyranose mutase